MSKKGYERNVRLRGANVHDETLSVEIVEQIEYDRFGYGGKSFRRRALLTGTSTRPVVDKYIYILRHQGNFDGSEKTPQLCDEIYADSSGNWYEAKRPGTGEDLLRNKAGQPLYYPTPEKVKGYIYHFFLTHVRLDSNCIQYLKKWVGKETAKRRAVNLQPNLRAGNRAWFISGGNITKNMNQVIDPEVTTVACNFEKTGRPYVVAVPDPFELARARSWLFYHGALLLLEQYNADQRIRQETIIAATLKSMGKNKGWAYIKNDMVHHWDLIQWWKREKDGGNKAPVFSIRQTHSVEDNVGNKYSVSVAHEVKMRARHWNGLSNGFARSRVTAVDLYLHAQELVREQLFLHANQCAQRLCTWLNGPRHRLVDQAARAAGGDELALAVAHWNAVTQRLSESEAGRVFLFLHAKDNTSLFHAMWTLLGLSLPSSRKAVEKAGKAVAREKQKKAALKKNFWEAHGDARKIFFTSIDLIKNFAGALHEIKPGNLDRVMTLLNGKRIFSNTGLVFTRIPAEKLTLKIGLFGWEKHVALRSSLKTPYILVSSESKLKKAFIDEKGFYRRFKLEGWFKGFSMTAKIINLFLAAGTVMKGKAKLHEEIKLGLDAISAVAEGVDIYRNLSKTPRLPGDPPVPAKMSALTKIGAVAGAIGGFIDFHQAVNSGLKSYYEKGNLLETAANVGGAVTAGISAGLGLYALLVPAAASGPIGWIALALGAVALFFSWLASRFSRDHWENFAKYSFLGTAYMKGVKFSGSNRGLFLGSPSTQFGSVKNLPVQTNALYGLMGGFYFKTRPTGDWGEALRGEIEFFPGWTGEKSKVTFYWQYESDDGHYTYLEVLFSKRFFWGKLKNFKSSNPKLSFGNLVVRRRSSDKAGQPRSFFIYPKIINQTVAISRVLVAVTADINGLAQVPYDDQFEFERRTDKNPKNIKKNKLQHCAGTIYTPTLTGGGETVKGF